MYVILESELLFVFNSILDWLIVFSNSAYFFNLFLSWATYSSGEELCDLIHGVF